MLPREMRVIEYLDINGDSPFTDWFSKLDSQIAAKVATAVTRMELGNLSNVKSVGDGVHEYRIHTGAGYRIYLGREGETLILLLGGGSKRRQARDIEAAKIRWRTYRLEKKGNR